MEKQQRVRVSLSLSRNRSLARRQAAITIQRQIPKMELEESCTLQVGRAACRSVARPATSRRSAGRARGRSVVADRSVVSRRPAAGGGRWSPTRRWCQPTCSLVRSHRGPSAPRARERRARARSGRGGAALCAASRRREPPRPPPPRPLTASRATITATPRRRRPATTGDTGEDRDRRGQRDDPPSRRRERPRRVRRGRRPARAGACDGGVDHDL